MCVKRNSKGAAKRIVNAPMSTEASTTAPDVVPLLRRVMFRHQFEWYQNTKL